MSDQSPQHGRREGDIDRRRWNDDRLDDLAHTVRAIAPLATQVARHDAVLDQLVGDIADFKSWITDVDERLTRRIDREAEAQEAFRKEYREDRDRAKKDRGAIVVAAITAAASILVALIGAAVLLIQGGGTP